jgi:hypothetical protein
MSASCQLAHALSPPLRCTQHSAADARSCAYRSARACAAARAGARAAATLAHSRFAYVRGFEAADALLPHTWIVVRIDGKGFTKCAAAR